MRIGSLRLRAAAVAGLVVLAVAGTACDSASPAAPGSVRVKGGVATYPLLGESLTWIWPFMPASQDTGYNAQSFQWLLYRPLYMFGGNNDSITVNYALSPADAPVFSDGGKTVVISLKGWKWSDGEAVDAQDVIFWLNMLTAEKDNYTGYSPGLLPDDLASYRATGKWQVRLELNRAYSSYWFTYNQLAEITPMPAAWDVTSMHARPGSGGCEVAVARCAAVFKFLTAQASDTKTYTSSPIWSVVDGPWRLKQFSISGDDAFVPNRRYSGRPRPQLAEVKYVPYATDATAYKALKKGTLSMSHVPVEVLPHRAAGSALPTTNPLGAADTLSPFYQYDIYYYQPNLNNPVLGPVFRQLYVRQAMQELVDQPGMDASVFGGYAEPTSGGVPSTPSNLWEPAVQKEHGGMGPYPFSVAAARKLLTSHGWQESGGVMVCRRPGKARGDCGAGISRGRKLAFTLDWATGVAATPEMMSRYKTDAAKAGVRIHLVGQSFQTVLNESAPCSGPKCTWDGLYIGFWVFDGPGFEPTGEALFETGAYANSGSYSSAVEDRLISETHTSSSLAVFHQYATYTATQLPYIWMPGQYAIWAVSSKLHGVTFSPIDAFLPEYWYYTK
jgi:peptide/nickel transport system substrate-binding protein